MRGPVPKLLPKKALVSTSDVDKAEWNFQPLLGPLHRLRWQLVLSLLPQRRFHRLLEIGYGSGVFLPELAQHCDELHAIDQHAKTAEVARSLRDHQIEAQLRSGSALDLPYESEMFDCIVAVSCLEYMDPFERAAHEIRRVLRRGGCLVFVTPGNSAVIDYGHYVLTGYRASEHYGNRRDHLMPTLLKTFVSEEELRAPRFLPRFFSFYRGFRLRPL